MFTHSAWCACSKLAHVFGGPVSYIMMSYPCSLAYASPWHLGKDSRLFRHDSYQLLDIWCGSPSATFCCNILHSCGAVGKSTKERTCHDTNPSTWQRRLLCHGGGSNNLSDLCVCVSPIAFENQSQVEACPTKSSTPCISNPSVDCFPPAGC